MTSKKNTAPDPLPGGRCPQCEQPGYKPGAYFHWSGDFHKQCALCGKDIDNGCPNCHRPGWQGSPIKFIPGLECPNCGKPWPSGWLKGWKFFCKHCCKQVELREVATGEDLYAPYCAYCLMPLEIRVKENTHLSVGDVMAIEKPRCESDRTPTKKPKEKVEKISGKEWARFQRFCESLHELEDSAGQILLNWKHHLKYLQEEYSMFDEDIDDLDDPIRNMVRMLKFVKTGKMPEPEIEDDGDADLGYVSTPTRTSAIRPQFSMREDKRVPKVVEVLIEDISTGDL